MIQYPHLKIVVPYLLSITIPPSLNIPPPPNIITRSITITPLSIIDSHLSVVVPLASPPFTVIIPLTSPTVIPLTLPSVHRGCPSHPHQFTVVIPLTPHQFTTVVPLAPHLFTMVVPPLNIVP